MIQRVGKGSKSQESHIGFLSTDYEALAKEVQATDDKYNGVRQQENLRVAQRNSGSMYSQKNLFHVGFTEKDSVPQPEQKVVEQVELSLPQKLQQAFNPEQSNYLQGNKSVARVSSGTVGEQGGPSRYIKSETAPSIWDNDKLVRASQEIDSRTKTQNERAANTEERQTIRQQTNNSLIEKLQDTDTRKAANIASAADQIVSEEQSRFAKVTRNISIFDTMQGADDFARLPQQTTGEKIAAKRTAERQEDDQSWRSGGRISSTKSAMNNLFDALMRTSEEGK